LARTIIKRLFTVVGIFNMASPSMIRWSYLILDDAAKLFVTTAPEVSETPLVFKYDALLPAYCAAASMPEGLTPRIGAPQQRRII